MKFDTKSGLWLPDRPQLCSMFPVVHGVAGAAATGAGGGIAKVQNSSNVGGGSNSVSTTFGASPTQNNLLIAASWMNDQASQVLSISGWSQAFHLQVTYIGDDGTVACFYKVAGPSESSTVTVDSVGSLTPDTFGVHAMEWSGMATSTPLDVTATNDETGGNTRVADTGTTAATAQADALAIAACTIADNDFDANPTFSDGYTRDADLSFGGAPDGSMAVGFKILSATGTQNTKCTWTGGGSAEERFSGIAVFKGA